MLKMPVPLCLCLLLIIPAGCATRPVHRCAMWVDVYTGEPLAYEEMLDDLADASVVYLGERHTVDRHHALQGRIVGDLIRRERPLVLAIEQMECPYQTALDRYNRGEIDFAQLATETDWVERWSNYDDYRPIVEAAHAAGAPVVALNARSETVKQVARQGVAGLAPALREELPETIDLDDPVYEAHLRRVLMVHAMMPEERLRNVFEAQVTRDETMANALCTFLQSENGQGRTAVVLCGAGHVSFGMGIPCRVRRRMPGIRDRIVIMSESGDVELSPAMQKMARDIEITHEQMRELDRPIADYLHVISPKP